MAWKLWHTVATVSVGFVLVVSCGSNEEDTNPNPYDCGNGGAAASTAATNGATTTASTNGATTTAATNGATTTSTVASSTNAAGSTVASSAMASSAASGGGGGSCSPATCSGASCCCTFNGQVLCIGADMCMAGGGKCQ